MRILRILLSYLVVAGILAVAAWFAGREVMLMWASSQIDRSISELRAISRSSVQYATMCHEKGVPLAVAAISQLRLRFVTPTEYWTEVVCSQFDLDPILVRRTTLPPMVKKEVGSTGIIFSDQPSGIRLSILGRTRGIGIKARATSDFLPAESLGVWPASTCGGYGFQCCDDVQEAGAGEQYPAALDCPRSCYGACQARPVVLSFTTDPVAEAQTRQLTIRNGESVSFSYQASMPPKLTYRGVIAFGDGQRQDIKDLINMVAHTYTCPTTDCSYQASIEFQTATNVTSANTGISQVTVRVVR